MVISEANKDRAEDTAIATVEAVVSLIPFVGGPLAVTWNRAAGSAALRRQQTLISEMQVDLQRLIERYNDVDPAEIVGTDRFIADFTRAYRASQETADQTKRQRLRNVLIHGLKEEMSLSEDESELFTRLVSRYGAGHIALLHSAGKRNATTRSTLTYELAGRPGDVKPEDTDSWRERVGEVRQAIADLINDGLLYEQVDSTLEDGRTVVEKLRNRDGPPKQELKVREKVTVTGRGSRFVAAIENPTSY